MSCSSFYLWDVDFGPAFIKISTHVPYPIKTWVNRHDGAKSQAAAAGIGFSVLSNGFATCQDPAGLDLGRLGPGAVQAFFERWMSLVASPSPLTEHDRAASYRWALSMRQVEVSRTLVFDAPRRVVADAAWTPATVTATAQEDVGGVHSNVPFAPLSSSLPCTRGWAWARCQRRGPTGVDERGAGLGVTPATDPQPVTQRIVNFIHDKPTGVRLRPATAPFGVPGPQKGA